MFLDRYGQLISLNKSGQLAMKKILQDHLRRLEWDESKFPVRLYPFLTGDASPQRPIAIDPSIAFGRPIVARRCISTGAIAQRIDAGETIEELAADYDMTAEEIEQAVIYERAA